MARRGGFGRHGGHDRVRPRAPTGSLSREEDRPPSRVPERRVGRICRPAAAEPTAHRRREDRLSGTRDGQHVRHRVRSPSASSAERCPGLRVLRPVLVPRPSHHAAADPALHSFRHGHCARGRFAPPADRRAVTARRRHGVGRRARASARGYCPADCRRRRVGNVRRPRVASYPRRNQCDGGHGRQSAPPARVAAAACRHAGRRAPRRRRERGGNRRRALVRQIPSTSRRAASSRRSAS